MKRADVFIFNTPLRYHFLLVRVYETTGNYYPGGLIVEIAFIGVEHTADAMPPTKIGKISKFPTSALGRTETVAWFEV